MQGNCCQLCQERIRMDIRKEVFTEKVVRHWDRLPREVVVSPSLEMCTNGGDVARRDTVSGHCAMGWGWTLQGLFQP